MPCLLFVRDLQLDESPEGSYIYFYYLQQAPFGNLNKQNKICISGPDVVFKKKSQFSDLWWKHHQSEETEKK